MMVIMQNKKANEFSPTPHYFHETNVMMTLFATSFFFFFFWLVSYFPLYLHVSFIFYVQRYGKTAKINVSFSLNF